MNKNIIRHGVIDIGTNSVRLIIADFYEDKLVVSFRALKVTRLGDGFSKDNYLLPSAIARTVSAVKEFFKLAVGRGASVVDIIATSAVREARNRNQIINEVFDSTNRDIRVLSGKEEASLSYRGAVLSLGFSSDGLIVMDLGGGSTEFVWTENNIMKASTTPVGVVKLQEKFHLEDLPSEKDIESAKRYLEKMFGKLHHPKEPAILIASGGTVTTLSAVNQQLHTYDPRKIHGSRLHQDQVSYLYKLLVKTPLKERRNIPGLIPDRADVIAAGVIMVSFLMKLMDVTSIYISEGDLMIGMIAKEGQKIYV